MNEEPDPDYRLPTTWGLTWAAALGGLACVGCGAVSMFAALLIGSDEALAARPFGIAAFVFVGLALTLFSVAVGSVLSRAIR